MMKREEKKLQWKQKLNNYIKDLIFDMSLTGS